MFRLELLTGGQTVSGSLREQEEPPVDFTGWIGLAAALQALIEPPAGTGSGPIAVRSFSSFTVTRSLR